MNVLVRIFRALARCADAVFRTDDREMGAWGMLVRRDRF